MMPDGVLFRVWKDQAPSASAVLAAPHPRVCSIDDFRITGIEYMNRKRSLQIEHPPALAAIVRDECASHVAVLDHDIGVVRAYGGRDHRAAASRSQNLPPVEPGRLI